MYLLLVLAKMSKKIQLARILLNLFLLLLTPMFGILIRDIESAIRNLFPKDKDDYIQDFKGIKYRPSRKKWPEPAPDDDYITCQNGLQQARCFVISLIGNVNHYWTEDLNSEEAYPETVNNGRGLVGVKSKTKLQIFISSTYEDMKVERQAAVEAILKAGHIPAGMELFTGGDKSQWDVIKKWIKDSDAFMLILGGRYGSIEKGTVGRRRGQPSN